MEDALAYFEEKVAKDFQKSIARGVGKKGPLKFEPQRSQSASIDSKSFLVDMTFLTAPSPAPGETIPT